MHLYCTYPNDGDAYLVHIYIWGHGSVEREANTAVRTVEELSVKAHNPTKRSEIPLIISNDKEIV